MKPLLIILGVIALIAVGIFIDYAIWSINHTGAPWYGFVLETLTK